MYNREVYLKDPVTRKLVNDGVASVNDDSSAHAMDVLKYELETFVCDGQYEKGMEHILETYLKNINQSHQPAVWVSGFYGSGKSHLVKMLRALWVDTVLNDGTTARTVANLPQNIKDLLKELTAQSKRYGGLHASSGTLGAGSTGSVRLALLRIIFKSAGLPEQYYLARFIMWLKKEGIYDSVKSHIEKNNCDWQEELENFYVSEDLHNALIHVKPNLFSQSNILDTLNNEYPNVPDISSDDMINAIKNTLMKDGKMPLTLIVMDEVQQYIGGDNKRSMDVQEAVEACCKNFGGKLLFVGTGQTAVTGTSNLKKLEGRFTIRVELSDADVDEVIRKVILAKKASAINDINKIMNNNLGEISRHLQNTTIGHRNDDIQYFTGDYPILPVRRRFWENALRVLDQTGTESQLRNQLSMVHKAIKTNTDKELGHVISADYLYFDSADRLLQSRILPRRVHEKTGIWIKGNAEEKLMARACGLVFLINKLAGNNRDTGIKATADTIADLMVEDITSGSSSLRNSLDRLLDSCEILMKVGDEYRIQTEESSAWNDEFQSQRSQLANQEHRIETERNDCIKKTFNESVKKITINHGQTNITRELHTVFDQQLPKDGDKKIYIWVRDEWSIDRQSVRADALSAGYASPCIFVFIPKRSADDLRRAIIDFKAAGATLDMRGVPDSPEGMEAREAMDTTKKGAEGKIKELLKEAFSGAVVYQGGGNELTGNSLQDIILEGAEKSLERIYPQFHTGDTPGWDKVYSKAQKGAQDALKSTGYDGETEKNPVCRAIIDYIGQGKKGNEIRENFENPPYGWSRDTVDGALQVLLVTGLVRVQNEYGKSIDPKELERKSIGKSNFRVEAVTVSATQRIQVRKILQKKGCKVTQGEELSAIPTFLNDMESLADRAGGDGPKPERPDTSLLKKIKNTSGNGTLIAMYNNRDELGKLIDEWTGRAENIEKRWPLWGQLEELLFCGNHSVSKIQYEADEIKNQRLLLNEPDLIQPLLKSLEDLLRKEFIDIYGLYRDEFTKNEARLNSDPSWQKLPDNKKLTILDKCDITQIPGIPSGTYEELIKALKEYPLDGWNDRIDAVTTRIDKAIKMAIKELEPSIQTVEIYHNEAFKKQEDIDLWLEKVKTLLTEALKKGPFVIR